MIFLNLTRMPVNPHSGWCDAFAAKLDPSGNRLWHTFMGGIGYDRGFAVAVDGSGNIYVAGGSDAAWGTPLNAFAGGGFDDAFAVKLDPSGNRLWHTFIGGTGSDWVSAIAVDGSGNIYVAGTSSATWGTPVNAFAGGFNDAFATKLDSSGNRIWHTFIGGTVSDSGGAIAVDGSGNAYMSGHTAFKINILAWIFNSLTLITRYKKRKGKEFHVLNF